MIIPHFLLEVRSALGRLWGRQSVLGHQARFGEQGFMVIPKADYTALYVALKRILSEVRQQHEQDRHGQSFARMSYCQSMAYSSVPPAHVS